MRTLSSVALTVALVAACDRKIDADAPSLADHDELRSSGVISLWDDSPPKDTVALNEFLLTAENGLYSDCILHISPIGASRYSVLALKGVGTTSGYELEVSTSADGFKIDSSSYSPCFFMGE